MKYSQKGFAVGSRKKQFIFPFFLLLPLVLVFSGCGIKKKKIDEAIGAGAIPGEQTSVQSSSQGGKEEEKTPEENSNPVEKKEIELTPAQKAQIFFESGTRLLKEGFAFEAQSDLKRCIELLPKSTFCMYELGWAYFSNFEWSAALKIWKLLETNNPKYLGLKESLKKAQENFNWYHTSESVHKKAWKGPVEKLDKQENELRVVAGGDTMLGTDFPTDMLPSKDLLPFENVRPIIAEGDIRFLNYEGTLCEGVESIKCSEGLGKRCFAFRTPRTFAANLKQAGFNLISLANNHAFDFGDDGRTQTEQTLTDLGIGWSGRAGTVFRGEFRGIPVSMIAFHSSEHTNSSVDFENAAHMIGEEAAQERLVVVSFHGGAEGVRALRTPESTETYFGENRGSVRKFAKLAVESGADLVLGHGPHVLRGMEIYKGRLIAYSLGNFATYKAFNLSGYNGVSVLLEVDIEDNGKFKRGRLHSIRQTQLGVPSVDPQQLGLKIVRKLTQIDFPNSKLEFARNGYFGIKGKRPKNISHKIQMKSENPRTKRNIEVEQEKESS